MQKDIFDETTIIFKEIDGEKVVRLSDYMALQGVVARGVHVAKDGLRFGEVFVDHHHIMEKLSPVSRKIYHDWLEDLEK